MAANNDEMFDTMVLKKLREKGIENPEHSNMSELIIYICQCFEIDEIEKQKKIFRKKFSISSRITYDYRVIANIKEKIRLFNLNLKIYLTLNISSPFTTEDAIFINENATKLTLNIEHVTQESFNAEHEHILKLNTQKFSDIIPEFVLMYYKFMPDFDIIEAKNIRLEMKYWDSCSNDILFLFLYKKAFITDSYIYNSSYEFPLQYFNYHGLRLKTRKDIKRNKYPNLTVDLI